MATGAATMTTGTTQTTQAAGPGTGTKALANFFLAELEKEVKPTRKMLERVPMERAAWQPHPKSMPIGGLATHVANLPTWIAMTLNLDELDIAPVGEPPFKMEPFASASEMLAAFDKNVEDARKVLESATDERWNRTGRCWPADTRSSRTRARWCCASSSSITSRITARNWASICG